MNIINFKLQSEWSLWYHDLSSNNWSLDSYKLIMKIIDYKDLCFIMKNDIKPIFEDKQNINGGYWSLRISKKETSNYWRKLIYYLVIEGILENSENEKYINGISISPKINNCIFKIWNGDHTKFNISSLRNDIDIIKNNDIYYLQHEDKDKEKKKKK